MKAISAEGCIIYPCAHIIIGGLTEYVDVLHGEYKSTFVISVHCEDCEQWIDVDIEVR